MKTNERTIIPEIKYFLACTNNAIWVVKFQIGLEFWQEKRLYNVYFDEVYSKRNVRTKIKVMEI